MDSVCSMVLALARSGLLAEPCDFDNSVDWNALLDIVEFQGIVSEVWRGVRISGLNIPEEYATRLKAGFLRDVRSDRFQRETLGEVFLRFENEGIDHLPLKGVIMKSCYPDPVYRQMSDADIVIRLSQYPQIEKIVSECGWSFLYESRHELKWKKQNFYIEFHKSATDPGYGSFQQVFGDVFRRAQNVPGTHRYRFSTVDEYVYQVAHFSKHYMKGGARLRSLSDLYYLLIDRPIENEKEKEELFSLLDELGLLRFYNILTETVMDWMEGRPLGETGEMIFTNVLSELDALDSTRNLMFKAAFNAHGKTHLSLSAKLRSMFSVAFLPYSIMAKVYPVLKKAPVLLPFCWIYRSISTVLFRRTRLKKFVRIFGSDFDDTVGGYMDEVRLLGLENVVIPEEL